MDTKDLVPCSKEPATVSQMNSLQFSFLYPISLIFILISFSNLNLVSQMVSSLQVLWLKFCKYEAFLISRHMFYLYFLVEGTRCWTHAIFAASV
jgi:hypothetical protein